jgi:hypothetical protein
LCLTRHSREAQDLGEKRYQAGRVRAVVLGVGRARVDGRREGQEGEGEQDVTSLRRSCRARGRSPCAA